MELPRWSVEAEGCRAGLWAVGDVGVALGAGTADWWVGPVAGTD